MNTSHVVSSLGVVALATVGYLAIAQRTPGITSPPRRVGLTVPSQTAQIAAEQAGAIVLMPVAEGDPVTAGDVICRQSSRLQELEVQRLEALAQSNLRTRRAEAELAHLKIETERSRELAEKDIASESDLLAIELEQEMAVIKLEQAQLDQAQAVNSWRQAEERLTQRTVRTPLTGVVTQLFKHSGETTEELSPVAEVIQLDPLWIEFEVSLVEGELFGNGAQVVVSPAATPDDSRTAQVVFVSLRANPSSHSFMVRAAAPNPNHDWKAGLKMLVRTPAEAGVEMPSAKPPK